MQTPRRLPALLARLCSASLLACGDGGNAPPPVDTTEPTVELSLGSHNVTQPGDIALSATASDASGVSKVEFYERFGGDGTPVKIGEDSSEPYELNRPVVSSADNGNHEFTAKAYDAAGNAGSSNAETAVVSLEVTPPAFSLSASHERLTTHYRASPSQARYSRGTGSPRPSYQSSQSSLLREHPTC
jgi:Big-like domain-containing protein